MLFKAFFEFLCAHICQLRHCLLLFRSAFVFNRHLMTYNGKQTKKFLNEGITQDKGLGGVSTVGRCQL